MRKLVTSIALVAATTTVASAGEILGKITAGAASVGEGVSVEAKCGDKAYPAIKTDATGSYRLVVSESGKCALTISYKGQSAAVTVVSYDDAAQADIVLEVKDGKLTARRK